MKKFKGKPKPKKGVRKIANKKAFRKKRSRVTWNKAAGQMLIFHPKRIHEFFPERLITTHHHTYRLKFALGATSSLAATTQFFNIQLGQLYRPYTAQSQTNFALYSGAAPSGTALGDYATGTNYTGYGPMANIYDSYVPISNSLTISLDNYEASSDIVNIYVQPIPHTLGNQSTGLGTVLNEQLIVQNKYGKRFQWVEYVNVGQKFNHHISFPEFYGYRNLTTYLDDKVSNQFTTGNVNNRPYNDSAWQISFASGQSSATTGAFEMTIDMSTRVLWTGIPQPVTT